MLMDNQGTVVTFWCQLFQTCFPTEIRVSPTKPCGKGSKRKQDELEDEDEEQPTWVATLSKELTDEDLPEEDPDYEVGVQGDIPST